MQLWTATHAHGRTHRTHGIQQCNFGQLPMHMEEPTGHMESNSATLDSYPCTCKNPQDTWNPTVQLWTATHAHARTHRTHGIQQCNFGQLPMHMEEPTGHMESNSATLHSYPCTCKNPQDTWNNFAQLLMHMQELTGHMSTQGLT